MTPGSKESKNELDLGSFSNSLFKHLDESPNLDLRKSSIAFKIEHPALLKTRLIYEQFPELLQIQPTNNFFFELTSHHQETGKPYQINKFLKDEQDLEFLLPWSGVRVSKKFISTPDKPTKEYYLTQTWLDYALSPELWGPAGKWTRFHLKLCELFKKFNLLEGHPETGFYHLKSETKLIEKYGFRGDDMGDFYQIILPWDFSLSSLQKLEEIITQEF